MRGTKTGAFGNSDRQVMQQLMSYQAWVGSSHNLSAALLRNMSVRFGIQSYGKTTMSRAVLTPGTHTETLPSTHMSRK